MLAPRARRRADELRERVIAERGGEDRMDAMRLVHTSTWAVFSAIIEDQLARLMLGEAVEATAIATLANARRREGEVIGAPEPRDVTPSLSEYLRGVAIAEAAQRVPVAPGGDAAPAAENRIGEPPFELREPPP